MLRVSVLARTLLCLTLICTLAPRTSASTVHIHELTMAAPDVIAVEVRDPPFERGRIIELPAASNEPIGTWVSQDDDWGMVIGPLRRHLRIADKPPVRFLDRVTADDAARYRIDGRNRVKAVYRKSMPYDSGLYRGPNGGTRSGAAFKHMLYLKLDGPLEPGAHRISWPSGLFEDYDFSFNDQKTRAISIRSTQHGHRALDPGKVAYLSLWLPGGPENGVVDFRNYELDRFFVIDDAGAEVFSESIRLRRAPDEGEPSNGLPAPLVDYADVGPRYPIIAVQTGDAISVPGHDLKLGDRVLLERLQGEQDASALSATIAAVEGNTIRLADLSSPLPSTVAEGATIVTTHQANRAGTFVFELNYGAWQPARGGSYRLHVPKLGVSDPFTVSEDIWRKLAQNALTGLYHHRSGVALDGRFGYTRPEAFRPSENLRIMKSRLPLSWSTNWPAGFVPFEESVKAAWRTDDIAADDYWGGYMDAGDWDRNIHHLKVSASLIDLAAELPRDATAVRFGIPRSSETLPFPPYRDVDDLPDVLHEAIWNVDFYRRLQDADGSVRGGIESAEHPLTGSASFLEHKQVVVFAPDHISSYVYASAAARLARVLRLYGKESLAGLFEASAVSAWQAGERGFTDPDKFYADALEASQTTSIFQEKSWEDRKLVIQADAKNHRGAAAASLLRLTGEATYRSIVEDELRSSDDLALPRADAAWDYAKSAEIDPILKTRFENLIQKEARSLLASQRNASYPSMKHPFAPAGWGQGGAPDFGQVKMLMRYHQMTDDSAALILMERTMHGLLGANQVGLSFTTGIGIRNIAHPLHEDHRAMGVAAPAGITIYGWAPQSLAAYGWVFGPPWSPLAETGSGENAANRHIEPRRFSLPYFEFLVEHPNLVIQQEYTVHQTIGPMAAIALYLHANLGAKPH